MTRSNTWLPLASFSRLFAVVLLIFCVSVSLSAQRSGTIDPGTTVTVRTNETISADDEDDVGELFTGTVAEDVRSRNGNLIIPKGSKVEMVVNGTSDEELVLDLAAITVNGQRYTVDSEDQVVTGERKEGIGINKRTGKYVGGGAAIGAIIGAIAGGGKGAAIGAGVGAAGGAATQVLTRGDKVNVPSESLLTFRLQQPLRTDYRNTSYRTAGQSAAYDAGFQAGRSDADRNLERDTRTTRWTNSRDRRDYEAGYNAGYDSVLNSGSASYSNATVHVGRDNNVSWQAPSNARLYIQVDNNRPQLFAEGPSGTQSAPWIEPGHVYQFVLRDMNGNELARERVDTRQYRNSYRSR
jgi:hypothetical protein